MSAVATSEMRTDRGLDLKSRAVLELLCAETGPLYKTQAVKLPYLVDVVAKHVLGRPITDGTYEAWQHGVVSAEVYEFISGAPRAEPAELEPFVVRDEPGFEDRQLIELAAPPTFLDLLTEEEAEIVEFVAGQFGRMGPQRLGQLTKRMNSEIRKWPSSKPVFVDETAYGRLPVRWDEVDGELARESLAEAAREPAKVVRGEALERLFAEILG